MATEGDRRTTENSTSKSQNWNRRIDAGHGHSNVPVLFRLKNLQRVSANDADNALPPTKFDLDSVRQPAESREPNRAENSAPGPHTLRSDAARKSTAAPNAPGTKPAVEAKADPVTAPGKHGVSNGVIFLIAIVAIAFSVGRKMGSNGSIPPTSTTSIAANQSTPASTLVAGSESPKATSQASSTLTPEPLVVPTLPTLASDKNSGSTEASDASKADDAPKFSTSKSENGLLTLDMGQSLKAKDESAKSEEDSMTVPLTLGDDRLDSKASDKPLAAGSLETEGATAASSAKSSSEPNASAQPNSPLLSTNTPNTDLESMFQIRANYQNGMASQSQTAALSKMRQSPPNTSLQTNATGLQPNVAGLQPNVAGYKPTYGAQNNPSFNQAPLYNQPNGQTGTIPSQPVGYGGQSRSPIQTPTYGNPSMPNAAMIATPQYVAPVATMPNYAQSQSQTAPSGPAIGNAPYAQPANQPYIPLFKPADAPPMNTNGFAVPPTTTPYVPIGSQFTPEGYAN